MGDRSVMDNIIKPTPSYSLRQSLKKWWFVKKKTTFIEVILKSIRDEELIIKSIILNITLLETNFSLKKVR